MRIDNAPRITCAAKNFAANFRPVKFRFALHSLLCSAILFTICPIASAQEDEEDVPPTQIEKAATSEPAATKPPSSKRSSGKKTSKSSARRKKSAARKAEAEPTPSAPGAVPSNRASAAIVVDARTGQVFYEKNADQIRAPASTQKLLTALLIAEHGFVDRKVTVHPSDTHAEPTKLGIRAGDTYTRIDLLRALLVKSPNDVARCLARDHSGTIEAFARAMTERARELGALNSNFLNPNGLPTPGQYSTARDLSLIARAAYANPTIRSIVSMPHMVFRYADGRTRELENTNKVLRQLPYCNGMKTGYTDAAGYCLIVSGSRPGRDVIAVVLGERSRTDVRKDASALLRWGLWL